MEMREWLSVVFIVVIILILLDGFRRKWIARRNSLQFKLDKNLPPEGDDYERNHELPNGGARPAEASDAPYFGRQEDDDDFEYDAGGNDEIDTYDDLDAFDSLNSGVTESTSKEKVPVLTDVVELEENADEPFDDDANDDDFSADKYNDTDEEIESSAEINEFEPISSDPTDNGRIEPSFGSEAFLDDEPVDEAMVAEDQTELFIDQSEKDNSANETELQAPEEVIVFNVMAKPGEVFTGKELLPILMEQGMRLGDMSIFHRHGDMSGNGPVMFSMANMVNPGTFNISEMEEFTTPGISFFLQLPNPIGSMPCFEIMLAAVNAVKNGLNGDLKDEDRNIITHQTLEHNRERIRDFELKQLSGK